MRSRRENPRKGMKTPTMHGGEYQRTVRIVLVLVFLVVRATTSPRVLPRCRGEFFETHPLFASHLSFSSSSSAVVSGVRDGRVRRVVLNGGNTAFSNTTTLTGRRAMTDGQGKRDGSEDS